MKKYLALAVLVPAFLLCGCSNIKNKKITAENRDKIFDEIKTSKQLTVEEVQLLQGYMLRQAMASMLSKDNAAKDDGKTIGEIIEEQRKWIADEKVRDEEEKQKREKAKAEAEAQQKILRDALSVTIYDKGFESVSYQDYITIKLAYQNTSGKDIRGFKGVLSFQDLFGDTIQNVSLKEDSPLKNGESKRVGRTISYNQFMEKDTKLRNTEMNNLKTVWKPELILFTDGSSLKVDPAEE
jgi:hypothetical protein